MNQKGGPLDEEELAAWQGMLSLHARVLRDLDKEITARHHLPVRSFDVLITLFNAPEYRLRMSDLANRVMLSPSGLTRLVERLERDRLIERQVDTSDARSFQAVLTDSGRERLDEARESHDAVIRDRFTGRLSPKQLRQLGAIWSRVLTEEG